MFLLSGQGSNAYRLRKLALDWQLLSVLSLVPRIKRLQHSLVMCCDWDAFAHSFFHSQASLPSNGRDTMCLDTQTEMVKSMLGVEGRGYDSPLSIRDEEAESLYWQLSCIRTCISQHTSTPSSASSALCMELHSTLLTVADDFHALILEFRLLRLPPELWHTIREHVKLRLDTSIERRRRLFGDITLRSLEDVLFLRAVLCSKLSKDPIRYIIRHLTVAYCAQPSDLAIIVGMLPSVTGLVYAADILEEPWHGVIWHPYSPLQWRRRVPNLFSLVTVTLRSHFFSSLSSFLRLIAALPSLRLLRLVDVTWPPPVHCSRYWCLHVTPGSVLNIISRECPQDDHLLSAALLGYETTREHWPLANVDVDGLLALFGWLYAMENSPRDGMCASRYVSLNLTSRITFRNHSRTTGSYVWCG